MSVLKKLIRIPRFVAGSIREFGLVDGIQASFERVTARMLAAEDARRDRALGLDTTASAELADLGVDGEHAGEGFAYVASPARLVRAVLRDLPLADRDTTFVDLGSGKGRVLLVAAELPFAEVVGVEFAGELHAIARANVARVAGRRRLMAPIRLVHGDAAAFEWPPGPCVVYLNNPFSERVMARVIAGIEATLRATPRPFVVVYQEARHEPASDRTDNLALLAASPSLRRRELALGPFERLALVAYRIKRYESAGVGRG